MVDTERIYGFGANGSGKQERRVIVTDEGLECPFCHHAIQTQPLAYCEFDENNIQVFLKCKMCKNTFIGKTQEYPEVPDWHVISTLSKGNHKTTEFQKEIQEISPSFVQIFGEAEYAEQENLMEICGVGYRKALEFLIKDYIIRQKPDDAEDVKKKSLGNCIRDNIDSQKIKQIAEKAVWLGNDETHYVRKWEDKDLKDLKNLISITVHFILMDLQASQHIADMSEDEEV